MEESKLIPLTQGQFAIVDASDYEWLNQWKWFAHWEKNTKSFYAARNVRIGEKKTLAWMHREILGLKHGDGKLGDHREPSGTLDNRRANLRVANDAQSVCNRRMPKSNRCGAKGCSLNNGSYLVRVMVNRKTICLGRRKSLDEAKALYAEGVAKYHGEFARVV